MIKKGDLSILDILMLIGLVLVGLVIVLSSGIIKKDCGIDEICFKQAMKACKTAEFITYKNNNVYSYEVKPSFDKNCRIKITLERSAAGSSLEFDKLVEDKSMTCKIPRKEIDGTSLDDFSGIIDHCSGPLKEGLYELIIQRMYSTIVQELSQVESTKTQVLKEF
jgi:hypothetical protein